MSHTDTTDARRIPLLDLEPEIEELWDELNAAFQRVLHSGQAILGPEVDAFEREVASYLGVRHAIGVNSGTDALIIALRALGVGPGDEVVTTPFTFFATAGAIGLVGATPVFVDIEEDTFNLDPSLLEAALGPAVRAILPVHLYGLPCDMDKVMAVADAHGVPVLEDCAQSFGAHVALAARAGAGTGSIGEDAVLRMTGSIGAVGAFSFYPTKNLGAFGDGGLIATNDDGIADEARLLRVHGSRRRYENERLGYNSRLDAVQAALLRVKLPHVDGWNARRRQAARTYNALLAGIDGLVTPAIPDEHVVHQYTIRIPAERRDAVRAHLASRGIDTMIYYPIPVDASPVFAHLAPPQPVSLRLSREVLSLPIGPNLASDDQQRVAAAIAGALEA